MTNVSIKRENNLMKIASPYNKRFINDVKNLGGKWDAANKTWNVDQAMEKGVLELLEKHYDYVEDRVIKFISIQYKAADFEITEAGCSNPYKVRVDNMTTAQRHGKEEAVELYNTFVVEGGFAEESGSRRRPTLGTLEGTILQTRIESYKYDRLSDEEKAKITIVEEQDDKEVLEKRKAELLAELEEINKKLAELK